MAEQETRVWTRTGSFLIRTVEEENPIITRNRRKCIPGRTGKQAGKGSRLVQEVLGPGGRKA